MPGSETTDSIFLLIARARRQFSRRSSPETPPVSGLPSVGRAMKLQFHFKWPTFFIGIGLVLTLAWMIFLLYALYRLVESIL
jgi:hypothetical protein